MIHTASVIKVNVWNDHWLTLTAFLR